MSEFFSPLWVPISMMAHVEVADVSALNDPAWMSEYQIQSKPFVRLRPMCQANEAMVQVWAAGPCGMDAAAAVLLRWKISGQESRLFFSPAKPSSVCSVDFLRHSAVKAQKSYPVLALIKMLTLLLSPSNLKIWIQTINPFVFGHSMEKWGVLVISQKGLISLTLGVTVFGEVPEPAAVSHGGFPDGLCLINLKNTILMKL